MAETAEMAAAATGTATAATDREERRLLADVTLPGAHAKPPT